MKIAIDCRMYGLSGIGVYLREILPYILNTKNNFLLLGEKDKLREYEKFKNVEIFECNIPIFSIKELLFFPVKEINKCDIFYTPNYNIPSKIKIPIYLTIHDVIFLDMPELTSKFGYLVRKIYYKRAYYLSEAIFTVSNFSKTRIEHHLGKNKNIMVTYNGISKYILKNEKIIYEKKDYIIFVGNIKKHKGLKTLLLAFEEAKKEGINSKLVIVGNQNNFKTKDKKMIELLEGTKGNDIEFTGYVNDEKLKKLIAEAKILVQPSLYEGFGIPPLEAMALGTEVIVSDIEVFRELFSDYKVVFFSSNNYLELKELLKENKEIVTNNLIDIEKYNYKNVAQKILKVLNNE